MINNYRDESPNMPFWVKVTLRLSEFLMFLSFNCFFMDYRVCAKAKLLEDGDSYEVTEKLIWKWSYSAKITRMDCDNVCFETGYYFYE